MLSPGIQQRFFAIVVKFILLLFIKHVKDKFHLKNAHKYSKMNCKIAYNITKRIEICNFSNGSNSCSSKPLSIL